MARFAPKARRLTRRATESSQAGFESPRQGRGEIPPLYLARGASTLKPRIAFKFSLPAHARSGLLPGLEWPRLLGPRASATKVSGLRAGDRDALGSGYPHLFKALALT
jgi:hypothetical protein